jgi:hypothetical protein
MCGAHGSRRRWVRCPRSRPPTLKLTRWYSKSQIAIEFCWRWCEEKPHFSIFWIYAAAIETFDAGYAEIARKLRLPCSSPGSSKDDVRDGVKDWLEENSDWLMVIDNADTYGDFFGNADHGSYDTIRDALPLPRPGSAMILYTSRHARIGEELTEHHHLQISNLSMDDSRRLLINKLGASVSDERASALLEALEHLPMSIAHAAAYIKFTKISIQQYLSRVKDDANMLDLLGSHHVHVGRRDGKAPRSVVKVILTTLDLLILHNEHAANLLYFMVCLDRQHIPAAIASLAIDERTASKRRPLGIELPRSQAELESAIGELESLALISRRVEGQSFTLHRLVHVTLNHCMLADRTQTAYLLLCAYCLMESFFPGVGGLIMHYENGPFIGFSERLTGFEQVQQSLEKYPSGFMIGLRCLCRLGIFSHIDDDGSELRDRSERQVDWLKYICSLPLEAVLAAAKLDLELDDRSSSSRRQSVQIMGDLAARKSFEQLERLTAQTIQESSAHSFPMVAAKIYLARAVAGMGLEMDRLPMTTRPVAVLFREAEEEAGGMSFEHSESPQAYYDHCSLAAIFLEAGCPLTAVLLQERACDGLARIFGHMDLDVLAYRVYLAELKGPYATGYEVLHDLEQNLQTWYDRMQGQLGLASVNGRDSFVAIDHIGRVKVLICRRYLANETILAKAEDEAFSKAVHETERILKESLLRMEKLAGVLDPATWQKTVQIHGFLTAMGPVGAAAEFASERATALLEATSNRNLLTLGCASILTDGAELFLQHDSVRPICERILAMLQRKLETQQACGSMEPTAHVIQSILELIQASKAQNLGADHPLQTTVSYQHYAFCDRCNQVHYSSPAYSSSYKKMLTLAVHHRHPPQVLTMPGLRCVHAVPWARWAF